MGVLRDRMVREMQLREGDGAPGPRAPWNLNVETWLAGAVTVFAGSAGPRSRGTASRTP
jgi:hypothetical protein